MPAPGRTDTERDSRQGSADNTNLRRLARAIKDEEIAYIPNPSFVALDVTRPVDRELVTSEQVEVSSSGTNGSIVGGAPHLVRLCETELLTADAERELFRRMNLFKFRASHCRAALDPEQPVQTLIESFQDNVKQARSIRDQLIKSNMRLAISITRKYVSPQNSFDDLLSDAIISLMNAIEKFDYSRGFRFSTYAFRTISRGLSRSVRTRHRQAVRSGSFDSNVGDWLEDRSRSDIVDLEEQAQRELLSRCINRLNRREQLIVRSRHALGLHRRKRTFRELGERLGISKERVRQIEARALRKIEGMISDAITES